MTHPAGERPPNAAAWIPAKRAKLEVGAAPYAPPRDDEIVVKNHAVAINPVDWAVQAAGDLIFTWTRYPFVLGSDLAGEVVEVGSRVTRFKAGDRVLAHAVGSDPKRNRAAEGAFQTYTAVLERMAAPIPATLSYERAAVVPLGLSTAACALFERDQLALDPPSAQPVRNGRTVLVWGGSTSVGCNAIQLAVAAGYDVIATSSPRNFALLKALGARAVFDYASATVVADIVANVGAATLAGAVAIGAGSADPCLAVVRACAGDKVVALVSFPIDLRGLVPEAGRRLRMLATMRRFVWFNLTWRLKTRLRGVRSKFVFGSSLCHNDVGPMIYERFLPAALAEGRFVAAPEPHVAGDGLAAVQPAFDVQMCGVSAAKVVVTLTGS